MSILIQSEPPFFQSPQCTPHGKTYNTWILVSWLSDRDSGSCLGLLLDEFICRLKSGGVMDPGPSYKTLQTNDFRFLNFWKSPFQARDMVILPKLVKILHSRPEIQSIEQNWWKSCDGYPLWLDVACLPEVPLSWVTVPWQEHFILMVLGFWIFAKLHSRPEKWVFEHRQAIFTKFGKIPQTQKSFQAWLTGVQRHDLALLSSSWPDSVLFFGFHWFCFHCQDYGWFHLNPLKKPSDGTRLSRA